jgi:tetratricopeptide (TPR) repeat protein
MRKGVVVMVTLAVGVAAARAEQGIAAAPGPEERAIAGYLQLEKEGKAGARDLAELGVLLAGKGETAAAESHLRAAVKKDKHDFDVIFRLALFLHREGRPREAVRYYSKALHERPDPYARFMLALAEERCGRRRTAIRHYAEAFHARPELASPEKNPLVYYSDLVLEAQLARYHSEESQAGVDLSPLDPAAVRRMMEASPPAPAPQPTPAATAPAPPPPKS